MTNETGKLLDQYRAAAERRNAVLTRNIVRIYNEGYHAGHDDTVEASYTHILSVDMDSYHDDIVQELVEDILAAQRTEQEGSEG